jgi:uncharacterized protein (TIGR00251 family)
VSGWARRVAEGWLLAVHVQPGAKRNEIAGLHGEAVKVRIAAPPAEGRANATLEEFIAHTLGVPKSSVSVVKGRSSRQKTVLVAAPQTDPGRLIIAKS